MGKLFLGLDTAVLAMFKNMRRGTLYLLDATHI